MLYRTGKKALCAALIILIGIPLFFFTVKYALAYMKPELYPGDRLETRPCRQCGGSGKDADMAQDYPALGGRCPFCRGSGKVEVILPGPLRPTRIRGLVMDVAVAGEDEVALGLAPRPPMVPIPILAGKMPPVPGAIAEATVVFEADDGEEIEVRTDRAGRFSRRLAPGSYSVTVRARGFGDVSRELDVEPLTEPIWLEKATLVGPDEGPDEARSARGLDLTAGLSLGDREPGFIRIEPATW